MNEVKLSVREIRKEDVPFIAGYWLNNDSEFLIGMGVDLNKVPSKNEMEKMLEEQINSSITKKKSYCIIWLADENPVGHCNVNKIIFGEEAYMHLHIWTAEIRKKGFGREFIKMTLPYFFQNLQLKKLYCEPYALNPAPNKTLVKTGFLFVKKYVTTPGWINFEQEVNLWEMSLEKFNNG